MKAILFSLILFVFLTACGQKTQEPEIVVPEPPPVVAETPEPVPPAVEEKTEPSISLPPPPEKLPVYLFGNRAFDRHGQLLFTCPREQLLSLPSSYGGNSVPPVLAVQRREGDDYFYDYYDWNGQPVLTGIPYRDFMLTPNFCGGLLLSHTEALLDADGSSWPLCSAYAWPSGALLYTKVWNGTYLEQGRIFLEFRGGQNSLLLDEDGTVLKEFPPNSSASLLTDEQGVLYLSLLDGKRCTLLDTWGEPILDESFREIYAVTNDCVIVQRRAPDCCAVDLRTGETVFEGTGHISVFLPDCLAMAVSGGDGSYRILDRQGNPLSQRRFQRVLPVDTDRDGGTDLLLGLYFRDGDPNTEFAACLDARGQELWTREAHETILTQGPCCITLVRKNHTRCSTLVELKTGRELLNVEGFATFARTWLCDETPYYIEVLYENAQGHPRTDYYAPDGTLLADGLQRCRYLGGGVVSCRKGFTQGLFDLETGQWLYRESVFSDWQAEDSTQDWW